MNDILPKTTQAPDIIVNNVAGDADEQQIVIENWLAEKSSQDFLERIRKGGKKITLGYGLSN